MKCFLQGNILFIGCMTLLAMPVPVQAQVTAQSQSPQPPIGAPLVREGDLAIDLQRALAVGTGEDEVEAESRLAAVGISPRNGWIADYPVTPDIIGELYRSVRDSAASGRLSMGVDEARKRLNGVIDELKLSIRPADNGKTAQSRPPGDTPPIPEEIHDYYAGEGPPIVTYYPPPLPYYSLYAWVPYPFWWSGFWFSGYFVLNDFHRPVFINNRSAFISNHFRDIRRHRVFRIDPYLRYRGRTYSGIGVHRRDSISTGVPRSDRNIFNRGPDRGVPDIRPERVPGGDFAPRSERGGGGERRDERRR